MVQLVVEVGVIIGYKLPYKGRTEGNPFIISLLHMESR